VTSFGKNRDGDGTILRLWELAGTSGQLIVILPAGSGYATASECKLRGELTGSNDIKVVDGKFEVTIQSNKPATFILK